MQFRLRHRRRSLVPLLTGAMVACALYAYIGHSDNANRAHPSALDRPVISFRLDNVSGQQAVAALERNAHIVVHVDSRLWETDPPYRPISLYITSGTVREALNAILERPPTTNEPYPLLYTATSDRIDVSDPNTTETLRVYDVGDLVKTMVGHFGSMPIPSSYTPEQVAHGFLLRGVLSKMGYPPYLYSPLDDNWRNYGNDEWILATAAGHLRIAAMFQALREADRSAEGSVATLSISRLPPQGNAVHEFAGNPPLDAARKMLEHRIAKVDFEDITVRQCMQQLEQEPGVVFSLPWETDRQPANANESSDPGSVEETRITLHLTDTTVGNVLQQISDCTGRTVRSLPVSLRDGLIQIGQDPQEPPEPGLETRIYNVRDIERAAKAVAPLDWETFEEDRFCYAVERCLWGDDPMHWGDKPQGSAVSKVMGLLLVTETPANHVKVAEFLHKMRADMAAGRMVIIPD